MGALAPQLSNSGGGGILTIDQRVDAETTITGVGQANAQVLLGPFTYNVSRGADNVIGTFNYPLIIASTEIKSDGTNILRIELQEDRDGGGFPGSALSLITATSATYATRANLTFTRDFGELANTTGQVKVRIVAYMAAGGPGAVRKLAVKALMVYAGPGSATGIL